MVSAIIVAAGKGTRMGANVDKLLLEVAGRPVIAHTWQRFDSSNAVDEIVLVVREELQARFGVFGRSFGFKKPFKLVPGGVERQDSVANGLDALDPRTEIVAIQDGARPCTSPRTIEATIEAAREAGAAVAAQRVTDTIKESADFNMIGRTLDRSRLWAVQTPQAFRVEIIRRAIQKARDQGIVLTDDTAACELIGHSVRLVEDQNPNPKVTLPSDLVYVELLLKTNV